MDSIAFVGETAGAPPPRDTPVAWVARASGRLLALAIVLVLCVQGWMLGGVVTPFHYYDDMAVVAVAVGPAVLVLAGPMLLAPGRGGPLARLNLLCGLVVFLVLIPGNYVLYANQRFDRSPAVARIAPVVDTWIRTDKHGHKSYMAAVGADVASPLGRRSFYGSQPVALKQGEWEKLVPGRSSLVLREHRGWLRFAWFEPDPEMAP